MPEKQQKKNVAVVVRLKGGDPFVFGRGVQNLPNIIEKLIEGGLAQDTPIALIRWGTRPDQEELFGNLDNIIEIITDKGFEAPAIAVIGKVVNFPQSYP